MGSSSPPSVLSSCATSLAGSTSALEARWSMLVPSLPLSSATSWHLLGGGSTSPGCQPAIGRGTAVATSSTSTASGCRMRTHLDPVVIKTVSYDPVNKNQL